jgi:colanic acid biosynthesis glycosyl transferase WcaI
VTAPGARDRSAMSPPTPKATGPLHIVLHDYGGYPFTLQLARTLAARGHKVLYLYAVGLRNVKAPIERRSDDSDTLTLSGIPIHGAPTTSLWQRLLAERRYATPLARRITDFGPAVVISANAPLNAQATALRQASQVGAAFVFWMQDVHSLAIGRVLRRRLSVLGRLLGLRFNRLERRLLQRSDAVIAITGDFVPLLRRWRIPESRISVIANWAPLDEVRPLPRANRWSVEHGLAEVPVFLYAGTLGLKHDPERLLGLAQALPEVRVVVVSEGRGANWLHHHGASTPNLVLLPFQPGARFSEVLASADVLVAILDADAGEFSVPSKVLTYLTASRPILAAMPDDNSAATMLRQVGAGRVVSPADPTGLVVAAKALLADPQARGTAAQAGHAYALSAFEIGPIADRFEAIINGLVRPVPRTKGASPSDTAKSPQLS